uniref:Solute carrier family 30 member 2 n=1 Tax=Sinocyclocheilus anshuiensis TaxID=1608454 RepID=A0A671SPA1_9TELE
MIIKAGVQSLKDHCNRASHGDEAANLQVNVSFVMASEITCVDVLLSQVVTLLIMTDAAHLLTDFGSISISLFALWISSRPPSKHRTFGWHRSEVLGSLLSVLSIWTVTVVLVLFAVQRLISDDYEIHSDACAVTLNIFLAFILHQSPVHHSHSHGLTEEHRSTSVKAAFIHMLGDLLQRLGVLLAASIIYFRVCTLLLLAYTNLNVILSEGVPCGVDFDSVKDVLLSVSGVKSTHSLRMWSLTTSETQLSVHAVIDEQTNPQTVLMDMTRLLQTQYGFSNITIQTEMHTDDVACCLQCQDPMD